MTGRSALIHLIDCQRGHLFPWLPVALGTGVGLYFALPAEPGRMAWVAVALAGGMALVLARRYPATAPLWIGLAAVLAGLCLAGLRTAQVSAPVLSYRYYGPIEGRIVAIDRSASDAVRLTLDRVVLARTAHTDTPARVRVSLHGRQGYIDPVPGLTVILTGHLSPPAGPVEPGGFDFRRQAWFQRLGAIGYTRTPVLALDPPEAGATLFIHRLRDRISRHVRAAMPGEAGAFAAAIMTGDRSAIGQEVLEDLRAANLAHLLAISGLHMGLLTGFVFAMLRFVMAAIPRVALRWPVKKIAALGALAAGAGYLALSGGNVATERAFVMVAVVFAAVLLDRRALTLRAVAVAAIAVLVLRPEALTGPGFQMSFAATTALIAVFGWLRGWDRWRMPKYLRPVAALVVSSAVAGAATAPVAAVHFNQVPHYGLIANFLAVPLMGTVIVPSAVLAALLAPFGFDGVAYAIMRPAIGWILAVADTVSGWEGALSQVPSPGPAVLPLMALGGLMVALWQGQGRLAGLVPLTLAAALWAATERPPLLIADTGRLIGLLMPEGRALSKPRGDGFAASAWLENDGDPAEQAEAASRAGLRKGDGVTSARLGDTEILIVGGRGAARRAADLCRPGRLIITGVEIEAGDGCELFDASRLRETGAIAVWSDEIGLRFDTVAGRGGNRPWNGKAQ